MNLKFIFGSFCLLFIWSACKKSSVDATNFFIKHYGAYYDSNTNDTANSFYTYAQDIAVSQNGYLILGKRNRGGADSAFLMEVDMRGDILWELSYDPLVICPNVKRLLISSDKQSVYVLSNFSPSETSDGYSLLTHLTAAGTVVTSKVLGETLFANGESRYGFSSDMILTSTGDIIVVGTTKYINRSKPTWNDTFRLSDIRDTYRGYFDASINVIKEFSMGGNGQDFADKIVAADNDSFWMVVRYNMYFPDEFRTVRLYKISAQPDSNLLDYVVAPTLSGIPTIYDAAYNSTDKTVWMVLGGDEVDKHLLVGINPLSSSYQAKAEDKSYQKLYWDNTNNKLWLLNNTPATLGRIAKSVLPLAQNAQNITISYEKKWANSTNNGNFNQMLFVANDELVFLGNFQLSGGNYVNTLIRTDKDLSVFCEDNTGSTACSQ